MTATASPSRKVLERYNEDGHPAPAGPEIRARFGVRGQNPASQKRKEVVVEGHHFKREKNRALVSGNARRRSARGYRGPMITIDETAEGKKSDKMQMSDKTKKKRHKNCYSNRAYLVQE